MKIFKNAWFTKYAKREKLSDKSLVQAVKDASNGIVSADLGGNLLKQRIAKQGKGKSGGYRTIIAFKREDKAFFLYGFAKNQQDNLEQDALKSFKNLAKQLLVLDDNQIKRLLENGVLTEIDDDQTD
jgi:hypothetical protein